MSQRRACLALRFCRSSMHYRARLKALNETLRVRIKDIASARIRYGYRRIWSDPHRS
ncbi:MAG: hypothetical protein GIX00_11265 [Candidatus Eremiobacteraeota bacterium]|nr:hypothetical protein [Candidatus Eremiobacteraeota bacterium]MBC5809165.1 hypothetical protein [Candidatus Eremiobacteraeota bacterium]